MVFFTFASIVLFMYSVYNFILLFTVEVGTQKDSNAFFRMLLCSYAGWYIIHTWGIYAG